MNKKTKITNFKETNLSLPFGVKRVEVEEILKEPIVILDYMEELDKFQKDHYYAIVFCKRLFSKDEVHFIISSDIIKSQLRKSKHLKLFPLKTILLQRKSGKGRRYLTFG